MYMYIVCVAEAPSTDLLLITKVRFYNYEVFWTLYMYIVPASGG